MAGLASCADWTRGRGGGEPCAAACVGPCADPRVAQARTLKINSRCFASRLLGSTSESPPLWAAQTLKVRAEGVACAMEVAGLVRPRPTEGRNCEARWRPHLGLRPAASGAGLGPTAASAPISGPPLSGGRSGRPAARALGRVCGSLSRPPGHAGLIRVATRPGALGAEAGRVARGPSAEGQCGGNSWNGAVWRGRAPARDGGPQAELRVEAWRAMCQRLRGLRTWPVTKPAHVPVRLRSLDSVFRTVDLYSNS